MWDFSECVIVIVIVIQIYLVRDDLLCLRVVARFHATCEWLGPGWTVALSLLVHVVRQPAWNQSQDLPRFLWSADTYIESHIAGKWYIITLQEAIEYLDHEFVTNRFHVTFLWVRGLVQQGYLFLRRQGLFILSQDHDTGLIAKTHTKCKSYKSGALLIDPVSVFTLHSVLESEVQIHPTVDNWSGQGNAIHAARITRCFYS